jgi:hypothetical protein
MTLAARVAAEIDALLLDALVTHTPIPGVGVDGLVEYLAALHPTVPVALIESILPGILEAHVRRARGQATFTAYSGDPEQRVRPIVNTQSAGS